MSDNAVSMSDEAGKKPADFFTKLKNIFSFSGRISRRRYWITVIIMLPVMYILLLFCAAIFYTLYTLIPLLLPAFSVWILLAAAAKRLHDTGRSAWYLLLLLLPVISLILLVFLCFRGEQNDNKYGPPTANNPNNGLIAAMIGVSMVIYVTYYAVLAVWMVSYHIAIYVYALSQLADAEYRPAQTPEKICSNLKNIGTAVCAYQEQYNRCMPDGKNLDGFRQLAQVNQGKELACTCDNGKTFAYVGSGLQAPDPRIPVVICISAIHPNKIHYIDANGKTQVVQVKKHPESYLEAVEEIEKNTIPMNSVDMFTLTLTHWIYRFQSDQVRENAKLIDQAAQ